MSELPSGPLPADVSESILEMMHDVGLSSLSKKILRKRLEAKYKIDFSPHADEVSKIVGELMHRPEIQKELKRLNDEKESVSARRAGAKRGASGDKKAAKAAKPESKREVKEKKPDNYPKAALTAYFIYANEHRDAVKAQNPDLKLTQVLSKIGAAWQAVSEEEKARYQKLAEEDKKRFEAEMAKYVAGGGKVLKRGSKTSKGGKAKKEKDPNAPKRSTTAFFYFASDYRAKHPNVPAKQQMSDAGAEWKTLSEDAKKPYEELAAKDRKRYEAERAAYGGSKSAGAAGADESSSSDSSSDDDDESD